MVSFGLVPGVLLYNMFLDAPSSSVGSIFSSFVPFTGFVITLCSAYRLAKFNTLKTNSKFFKGLPTPANTMLIYSFSIISNDGSAFSDMISNYNVIIFITLICGFLLVSNIKLLNFKFKNLKFIGNRRRFLIIFVSVPSIIIYGIYAIPLILGLYILISIGTYYKLKT
jgi:CDP-diacylglycerol--serine O-phosphatidyltransferase